MSSEISDKVCQAALRGWCGYPRNAPLSTTQELPETTAAWRRAITAALEELEIEGCYLHDVFESTDDDNE